MRRLLLSFFILPFVLIVLVIIFSIALISTDSGLRFIQSQTNRWLDDVHIGSSRGNIWQGFELKAIQYQNPQNKIKIGSLRLDWDNAQLWQKTLHIKALYIKQIKLVQTGVPAPAAAPSEPLTELADIKLPLAIHLDHIQINSIEIQAADGSKQVIDEVILSANIEQKLELKTLAVKAPQFQLSSQGFFDLLQPHALDLKLDWQAKLPENPDLPKLAQGQAQISGDLDKLHIKHQATAPLSFNLDVKVSNPLKKLAWQAQIDWKNLRWPLDPKQAALVATPKGILQLQGDLNAWQLSGETEIKGAQIPQTALKLLISGDQGSAKIQTLQAKLLDGEVNLNGDAAWKNKPSAGLNLDITGINIQTYWADWPAALRINNHLALDFADNKLLIKDLKLTMPPSRATLLGQVQVDLNAADPLINTDLTWQNIQWPLTGEPLAEIAEGKLNFTGTPKAYQIALETQLDGETIPAGLWQFNGKGDAEKLSDLNLSGELLAGKLALTGQAAWSPAPNAKLDLDTQDIDLTELWADWPQTLRLAQQLHLEFSDNKLNISDLSLSLPPETTQIQGQAQIDLNQAPPQMQISLDWHDLQWPLVSSDTPALARLPAGDIVISGTPEAYQIQLQSDVSTPDLQAMQLDINASGNQKQLDKLLIVANLLHGQAKISGTAQWQPDLQAQLHVSSQGLNLAQFAPELAKARLHSGFKLDLVAEKLQIRDLNLGLAPYPLAISGKADIQLPTKTETSPQFDAALNWSAIQWPLDVEAAAAQVQIPQGDLHIAGKPEAYTLALNSHVLGQDLPDSLWQIQLKGDTKQAYIEKIDSQLLAGTVHAAGKVQWQPYLNWDIALQADKLNPAQKWPEWAGSIGWKINSQGQQKAGSALQATVDISQFGGKLRDYPLQLSGKLAAKDDTYQLKALRFNSGSAKFAADLSLDKQQQLKGNWQLNIADLGQVLPRSKGKIQGKGKLSGTIAAANAELALTASDISAQGQQLSSLKADLKLQQGQRINLSLSAENLQQADQVLLNKLGLTLKGRLDKHRLSADIDSPAAQVALAIAGGLDDKQQWQGKIQKLDLITADFDTWQLDNATQVRASAKQANIKDFCWQAQATKAQFCLQSAWNPATGSQVKLDIARLPFSLIKSVLPETTEIDGGIEGSIQAKISPSGRLYNQTQLRLLKGEVRSWLAGEQHRFPFQGGDIKLSIDEQGTQLKTDLAFLRNSLIKADLRLPQFKQLNFDRDQSLAGELNIQITDLGILPSLIPQLENTQGQLSVNLKLDGQVSQPNVQGHIALKAETDLPDFGLELRDLHTHIDAQGDQIQITGGVKSGEGASEWQGSIDLAKLPDWQAALSLKGEKMTVMNTAGIQALLSPDLKITASPTALDIQGQLEIPEAMISPNIAAMGGLSDNAVAVSEDAILIDADGNSENDNKTTEPAMQITANVLVLLNENIILDVADFKSSIDGALLISLQKNGELTGNGAVQIVNGTYRAYGQDLKIHQGFIIFPDVPLSDPVLNIKAIRKIYNDTNEPPVEEAGLHITGSGQLPVVSLFSEPMEEEANILSYIITGSALTGDVKSSALSLGTYVAPHIYASFGLDLLSREKEFTIRYDISKKWGVDAVFGDRDSGMDITYSIGR